jgi:hypothetical protein
MRGRGLPGCGRGVIVPISRKPKPRRARPSIASPFLSSPAARPMRLGKRRPMTSTVLAGSGSAAGSSLPA